ncbi:transcriptional regulator [Delftia acidovorans]|uniref:transcriptional regulator n=1 Tax=Delftia acidovorans TaxID=80866 RepID=UPI00242DA746|nr:YdaS family helix-turn-helix protein [Delftia acidovorans]
MTLSEYFAAAGSLSVARLRELIGAKSDAQVRQWQHGYAGRVPSPAYCLAIERATEGQVSRRDLRPKDCHLIWPDLPAIRDV